MAWATLPATGSMYGPCAEPCEHIDCAAGRRQAAGLCRFCQMPIGEERGFFRDPDSNDPEVLVHATCLLAEYDREEKARREYELEREGLDYHEQRALEGHTEADE